MSHKKLRLRCYSKNYYVFRMVYLFYLHNRWHGSYDDQFSWTIKNATSLKQMIYEKKYFGIQNVCHPVEYKPNEHFKTFITHFFFCAALNYIPLCCEPRYML